MVHISKSYISAADVKKLHSDVKGYLKSGKLKKDIGLQKSIADQVILAEKETLRYELIFHYGLEYGVPSVLDLVDREYLLDSFLAKEGNPEFYISSAEDVFDMFSVDEGAEDFLDYLDSLIYNISDAEEHFDDPAAYKRRQEAEAEWDE